VPAIVQKFSPSISVTVVAGWQR